LDTSFTTDVIEIDVDPIRCVQLQLFQNGTVFIIKCDIKSALFLQKRLEFRDVLFVSWLSPG
jgi:hypothetical protein